MSESKEVVATVLTDSEADEIFPKPDTDILLSVGDVRSIARFIGSIEVEGEEASNALASVASKLAHLFAKRSENFDILGFVSDCNFGDDKRLSLRVATSGFAARIQNNQALGAFEVLGLNNLAAAAVNAKPIDDTEDDVLEDGARRAAAQFTPNQDWVYITKKDSRYAKGGPYKVVDIDVVRGVVGIMVNNTRLEYKAYNLGKA